MFRLCLHLGIADPIEWMNRTPPAVIDRWIQFAAVEPLPDSWQQMAEIAAEVYGVSQWIAATRGKSLPERSVESWIPRAESVAKVRDRAMTVDQSLSWAARQAGVR